MKLLLDENLPHRLRPLITGHDCATVFHMGWSSKKNGELLPLAADVTFDALLTMHANLRYQQNQTDLSIAIVVLRAPSNDFEDIRPLIPKLLEVLKNPPPRQVTIVA